MHVSAVAYSTSAAPSETTVTPAKAAANDAPTGTDADAELLSDVAVPLEEDLNRRAPFRQSCRMVNLVVERIECIFLTDQIKMKLGEITPTTKCVGMILVEGFDEFCFFLEERNRRTMVVVQD